MSQIFRLFLQELHLTFSQLGSEGQETKDNWHRPHAILEDCTQEVHQWLPRWSGCFQEEEDRQGSIDK